MDGILAGALVAGLWLLLRGGSQSPSPDAPDGSPPPVDGSAALDYQAPLSPGDSLSGSSDYGLSAIVQAVQHFESRGRQYDANGKVLTSSAGALGIMQLEPSTAASLGVDPYDEQQNIAGGTAYLQQLYAKYGNWYDALAAYVWGPGKVDKAQAYGGGYPAEVDQYATGVMSFAGVNA